MADVSLRQRKKMETHRAVWHAAVKLFLARGFDNVSVAEIAAAANVSKMTVFNYFPTKEDLVFSPMEDHVDEFAKVVRERAEGQSVVEALRAHVLERLAAHDPITGLNDSPAIVAMQRLILNTPSLMPRMRTFIFRTEGALIEALTEETDPLTARVAAGFIMAARSTLMINNHFEITNGRSADEVYPEAVTATNRAFDLLAGGLGDL